MALVADQLAANAGDTVRADYLAIARQWRELADEMESLIHASG